MSDIKKIAQAMDTAWKNKDEAAFRAVLHENYSFKGPMMTFNNADEAVAMLNNCPFECNNENSKMITEGNTLVHEFDWVITAPFTATIPMVEILNFEDNKIKTSRLYFDTALLPEEAKNAMCQNS